jgi:hypothetical protein
MNIVGKECSFDATHEGVQDDADGDKEGRSDGVYSCQGVDRSRSTEKHIGDCK